MMRALHLFKATRAAEAALALVGTVVGAGFLAAVLAMIYNVWWFIDALFLADFHPITAQIFYLAQHPYPIEAALGGVLLAALGPGGVLGLFMAGKIARAGRLWPNFA